jgi:hypothetical protein
LRRVEIGIVKSGCGHGSFPGVKLTS